MRLKPFLSRHLPPERIFILSFAGLVLLGTLFLWMPFSSTKGHLGFTDALFASASAVCVTGLTVIDIGKDLSFPGQIITIFLFQVGGLGMITFSAFFFLLMGKGISFKEREIVQATFLHTPRREFYLILKSVLWFTFFFESLGAVALWMRFCLDFSPGAALYQALYHSISAFNNCGYSLFSDSLAAYQGDVVVNAVVMGLVVLGGIGFVVHFEVLARLRGKTRRLSVHTKIVLITTGILILSGAILFYGFERDQILKDLPLKNQVLASLFQSVVPRTAGFSTVDIGLLANQTVFLTILLMFIGASPGSTGGGIKTSSAALLFILMWNRMRGGEEVNVFRRTIPKELINRTLSIIVASVLSICIVVSVLLLVGPGGLPPLESRHLFVEYLFETISAFGTVGLSMNLTPRLNDGQKIAVILMMFAGRVGPLTLAFSLSRKSAKRTLTYAEEGVMVG